MRGLRDASPRTRAGADRSGSTFLQGELISEPFHVTAIEIKTDLFVEMHKCTFLTCSFFSRMSLT